MECLNYHHLHYFWIVAKEESVTKAGERLRLAPSTISMQISVLEKSLGGKLFRRVGRNLQLTELGRVVFVLTDSPLKSGLSVKAYSHLLGECGVTFCAVEYLAGPLRQGFPHSLNNVRMLLPTPMSAPRGSLNQWFSSLGIRPEIVGEFDDHALLKTFGQAGDGIFAVPSIIEREVCRQHNVAIIGRSETVKERFYAISVERIIKHPAVVAIRNAAKGFGEQWSVNPS